MFLGYNRIPSNLFVSVLIVLALCMACHTTAPDIEPGPEPTPPPPVVDPYKAIAQYDYGKNRKALSMLEEEIRTASGPELAKMEQRFIDLIQSEKTTEAGKQFVCRMLRRMGTDASVPVLASLLSHDKLSDAARFALQGNSSAKVDQVFSKALRQLEGDFRIGVISSIGQRKDATAVPALIALLNNRDQQTVRACLNALGALGGQESAEVLCQARVSPALEKDLHFAQIRCAHALLEQGKSAVAVKLFEPLTEKSKSLPVRIAAWQVLCRAEEEKAVPMLVTLLAAPEAELRQAALGFLNSLPQDEKTDAALMQSVAQAETNARTALIQCLTARETPGAVPVLLRCTCDEESLVRQQAFAGLAALAREEDLPRLLDLLDGMEDENDVESLKETILVVVRKQPDEGARTAYLMERYGKADGPARVALLDLLGRLPSEKTLAHLNEALAEPDPALRAAAVQGLAEWPDATPLQTLLDLAVNSTDTALRTCAHKGVVSMLNQPNDRTAEETRHLYRTAADLAMDQEGMTALIRNAGQLSDPWVLEFLEPLRQSPETWQAADEAYMQVAAAVARNTGHDALEKPVTLTFPYEEKYNGGGPNALTDGLSGTISYGKGGWQGFKGRDLMAVIDLGEEITIKDIRATFLQDTKSWIFPPSAVTVSLSSDGTEFRTAAVMKRAIPQGFSEPSLDEFLFTIKSGKGRYLKLHARSVGLCPAWHPGSGSPSWLFCDEIRVNAQIQP